MKSIFSLLLVVFPFCSLADINLQKFHNGNYYAVGNYCGYHAEVSGDRLLLTTIIPPNQSLSCGTAHNCDGETWMLICDREREICRGDGLTVIPLRDGNFYMPSIRTKFLHFNTGQYWWCPKA